MGYTSNVTAVFYTREKSKGRAGFIKAWLSDKGVMDEDKIKRDEIMFHPDYGVTFEWYGTKWYNEFDDVRKFMEVFEKFIDDVCYDEGKESPYYACEFIRIGEDDADVDRRSSDNHDSVLHLERKISVHF